MGPYAILILLGLKRVENRSAILVPAKGQCAISCSKSFCKEECGEFVRWASRMLKPEDFETIPAWDDVKDWPGKVVGCCDYEGTLSAPVVEEAVELFRPPRPSSPAKCSLQHRRPMQSPSSSPTTIRAKARPPSAQDRELTAALKIWARRWG